MRTPIFMMYLFVVVGCGEQQKKQSQNAPRRTLPNPNVVLECEVLGVSQDYHMFGEQTFVNQSARIKVVQPAEFAGKAIRVTWQPTMTEGMRATKETKPGDPFVRGNRIKFELSASAGQRLKIETANDHTLKRWDLGGLKSVSVECAKAEPRLDIKRQSDMNTAKLQIEMLESAVNDYYFTLNVFPDKLGSLTNPPADPALAEKWNQHREFLEAAAPRDPWGNEYVYSVVDGTPSIRSHGPDGQAGSADDISN